MGECWALKGEISLNLSTMSHHCKKKKRKKLQCKTYDDTPFSPNKSIVTAS